MNLSDPMTRYCRVALYAARGRDDCSRRAAVPRPDVTDAERSRQLRMLRFDHTVHGQCWNPR